MLSVMPEMLRYVARSIISRLDLGGLNAEYDGVVTPKLSQLSSAAYLRELVLSHLGPHNYLDTGYLAFQASLNPNYQSNQDRMER